MEGLDLDLETPPFSPVIPVFTSPKQVPKRCRFSVRSVWLDGLIQVVPEGQATIKTYPLSPPLMRMPLTPPSPDSIPEAENLGFAGTCRNQFSS